MKLPLGGCNTMSGEDPGVPGLVICANNRVFMLNHIPKHNMPVFRRNMSRGCIVQVFEMKNQVKLPLELRSSRDMVLAGSGGQLIGFHRLTHQIYMKYDFPRYYSNKYFNDSDVMFQIDFAIPFWA